ncbi:ATP-dependent DNA helicase PIF6-like [Eutrema salsugineum]|uniref:ATP-dependent DNA helicase PIF6-like n=1 Tax=Eutrema salsugineum TaxID=72664 RepID=UPI000CECE507|nr:ATP-dependent DNA helicase PIF6-like [Eutrema salsugineum]
MCLRNIDPKGGLCNGTRSIPTHLARHVIEGRIITGTDKVGDKVLIPRMFVTPPETSFPFRMRRRQFLVTLAFAINKSQAQSLQNVDLFLPRPVFSHGQLYVALSRVKSRSDLKILIVDKSDNVQKKTTNVV